MTDNFVKVKKKKPKPDEETTVKKVLKHFLNVNDSLDGQEIVLDVLEDLLATGDIDSEIDKVSVGFAFMGTLASYAEERIENYENEIKRYVGIKDAEAREGAIAGRATDGAVKAFIERDPTLHKMRRTATKYRRQYQIFRVAAQAHEIKSRMLQTKSANARRLNELSHEATVESYKSKKPHKENE